LGIFAIPPIVGGPKRYRVFGVITLLIAVAAVGIDYQAGKVREERWREIRDEIRKEHEGQDDVVGSAGVFGFALR
jgi:hypothetical protein